VRRVEAVAGEGALAWVESNEQLLKSITQLVKGNRESSLDKVKQLQEKNKNLERELDQLKGQIAKAAGGDLISQAIEVEGINVLAAHVDGSDSKTLREMVDQLKNKLGSAAVVLSTEQSGKVILVAGVSKEQTRQIKAGELVNAVAQQVGGKGGGRPDMAQAGGDNPDALEAALKSVPAWVKQQLAN
jgi:alanyl-tRNA synthetase